MSNMQPAADWAAIAKLAQEWTPDSLRSMHIQHMEGCTGRNVIAYYSGWCQKQHLAQPGFFSIDDDDMGGFMNCIDAMDKSRGLDLVLHTPGGLISATEALVHYFRKSFCGDVRVFVPHLAMSAGTMISLSSKEIWMGDHSSLGPIDPQIGGLPAHGILAEFEMAQEDWARNPAKAQAWMPILAKYQPTLIDACHRSIKRSEAMVRDWLVSGMFTTAPSSKRNGMARRVISQMAKQSNSLAHDRHFSFTELKELGLCVRNLSDDPVLRGCVLGVHNSMIYTFNVTPAAKIIESSSRKVIKLCMLK
jgi:hypothetical protein